MLTSFVQSIGCSAISCLNTIGAAFIFIISCISSIFSGRIYFKQFLKQCFLIGYQSLPVVSLTAIFTGAVLAVQTYTGLAKILNSEATISSIVVLSIIRELGPVITGLMLAGRVGAAMAAEIGTMAVTNQLDVLSTMNVSAYSYLFLPRIFAIVISMPILVSIADVIGIYGSYLVILYKFSLNDILYISKVSSFLKFDDWFFGIVKALVFGVIIAVVSCYCGLRSNRGAFGIALSTTSAVVASSILILFANYVITVLLFNQN